MDAQGGNEGAIQAWTVCCLKGMPNYLDRILGGPSRADNTWALLVLSRWLRRKPRAIVFSYVLGTSILVFVILLQPISSMTCFTRVTYPSKTEGFRVAAFRVDQRTAGAVS